MDDRSTQYADFAAFKESLRDNPALEAISDELDALEAIYGPECLQIHQPTDLTWGHHDGPRVHLGEEGDRIRYEVVLTLPDDPDATVTILVTLPPAYPESSHSPQLQILSRYIGDHGVDSGLFGRVLRTYFSIPPPDGDGVPFVPGDVAVWEGLEHCRKIVQEWYTASVTSKSTSALLRQPAPSSDPEPSSSTTAANDPPPPSAQPISLPEYIQIHVAEPILDRKSSFVGRAIGIRDVADIPLVLSHLLEDRKIAKAAHPIIHAYRVKGPGGGTMVADNDDDGESAAGGRIAHLLQILEVEDVLVVVTRYFGGIHLGADRFKHINQAARDALEIGGFLETSGKASTGGKGGGGKGGKGR